MKITKDKLIRMILEELNEVRPLPLKDPWSQGTSGGEEALRDLAYQSSFGRDKRPQVTTEADPTGVFEELYDVWQPETDEGIRYKEDLRKRLGRP